MQVGSWLATFRNNHRSHCGLSYHWRWHLSRNVSNPRRVTSQKSDGLTQEFRKHKNTPALSQHSDFQGSSAPITSLSKRQWNSFINPTIATVRNRGTSVGIVTRLRVRWLRNRGSIPFSRSRPAHPASNSMGTRIFFGIKADMTWSWQLIPSNTEVRNKCSYAPTHPYALKLCPFTFILTTTVQIGRYFLITSKCSNPHSFTQPLLSNPVLQTAKLMDITPPCINNLQATSRQSR